MGRKPALKSDDGQQSDLRFAERLKEALAHRTPAWLAQETGLSDNAIRKYLRGSQPTIIPAVAMASALNVSLEWLLAGVGPKEKQHERTGEPRHLFDATEADWVFLPHYRFEDVIGAIAPTVTQTFPFRRDWIKRSFGVERGLWVTEMPTDALPSVAAQGDTILCRNAAMLEVGKSYIMVVDGQLVVRRVSVDPETDEATITIDRAVDRNASLIGVILARVAVLPVSTKIG